MYPIGWTTNKMSILWGFFMYNKTKSIGVDEMSIKLFTKEEIEMLTTNKYVKHPNISIYTIHAYNSPQIICY